MNLCLVLVLSAADQSRARSWPKVQLTEHVEEPWLQAFFYRAMHYNKSTRVDSFSNAVSRFFPLFTLIQKQTQLMRRLATQATSRVPEYFHAMF